MTQTSLGLSKEARTPGKLAILVDSIGPYHVARAMAAAAHLDVTLVEGRPQGGEYDWERPPLPDQLGYVALANRPSYQDIDRALQPYSFDCVALPGWSNWNSLALLDWSWKRTVPAILMSETNGWDFPRTAAKEWLKRGVVSHYQAALVSSPSHLSYLTSLGVAPNQIFFGYNTVDNAYFSSQAEQIRASAALPTLSGKPIPDDWKGRYFLTSNRFIPKKNLNRLLSAYAEFLLQRPHDDGDWPLIMLGDGELRGALEQQVQDLGLQAHVHFAGFRQIEELPLFYANAGAFIHASTVEQWGLVVNEAMASGLPVAVSSRCGCAEVLVEDGVSGILLDPYSVDSIRDALGQLSNPALNQSLRLGGAQRIGQWGVAQYGEGMAAAFNAALGRSHNGRAGRMRLALASRLLA